MSWHHITHANIKSPSDVQLTRWFQSVLPWFTWQHHCRTVWNIVLLSDYSLPAPAVIFALPDWRKHKVSWMWTTAVSRWQQVCSSCWVIREFYILAKWAGKDGSFVRHYNQIRMHGLCWLCWHQGIESLTLALLHSNLEQVIHSCVPLSVLWYLAQWCPTVEK